MSTTPSPATARSVTKTVTIERPVAEVFAFVADAANWPTWAIVNVKAIEPTEEPDCSFFDEQIALVDTELATLKRSLETGV
ncbi:MULTISPECIES: SRPBCC family protein [unclassified Streptomyces]|uniref:SRPBCC family protein n=1 Tax=unclassified Streptomyces TaxID=2593676 RepID=UPI0004C8E5D3|nr:SRPBCC family protein [Streptomyces sp. NRRL F-2747]